MLGFKKKKDFMATPALDRFARDLTQDAYMDKIDPLIGRDEELTRMIQILSRRTKNNAILVGEAGTGKTALAEGLALAIIDKKVPLILRGKRVLALNLGSMLAGTQYRGEFESRMKIITEEIAQAGRHIILFIDEIQNLTQAGESMGAIGAAISASCHCERSEAISSLCHCEERAPLFNGVNSATDEAISN